jgi:hypothetical protein
MFNIISDCGSLFYVEEMAKEVVMLIFVKTVTDSCDKGIPIHFTDGALHGLKPEPRRTHQTHGG